MQTVFYPGVFADIKQNIFFLGAEIVIMPIITIWQAFVLANRVISLAADKARFSRGDPSQYAIFISLRG